MNSADATVGPLAAAAWSGIAASGTKLCTDRRHLLLIASFVLVLVRNLTGAGAPAVKHQLPLRASCCCAGELHAAVANALPTCSGCQPRKLMGMLVRSDVCAKECAGFMYYDASLHASCNHLHCSAVLGSNQRQSFRLVRSPLMRG
jgi:hypothetical protein